jgi:hypothetical protein
MTTDKLLLTVALAAFPIFTACNSAGKDESGHSGSVDVPRLMRARTCQPVLDWQGRISWETRWRVFENCQSGRLTVAEARAEMQLAEAARTDPRQTTEPTPTSPSEPSDNNTLERLMRALRELAELDEIDAQRISTSPSL